MPYSRRALLLAALAAHTTFPATAYADAPVTVTLDPHKTAQTMIGFGAATAYYQNFIARHPYKAEVCDALFKGLNLQILRVQNAYRNDPKSDFADDRGVVEGARAALGHPITLLMSAWSPPAALKSNGATKHGGTLAKGPGGAFVYAQYGKWWADSLAAYRKAGIVPTYVSIQNEPDGKADWDTCLFKPTEQTVDGVDYAGYDKALAAVVNALKGTPDRPKLIGPEPTGIVNDNVERYLPPANAAELSELYGVAHHLYNGGKESDPDTFLPALHAIRDAYPDKPKLQTEFARGDWFETAWIIHNCVAEENAAAYLYWSAVWPNGPETLMLLDNYDAPRNTWKLPHGWKVTPTYYALKHFSFFTAPGWKRLAVPGTPPDAPSVRISAFVAPDGRKVTAVLLNTSKDKLVTVRLAVPDAAKNAKSTVFRSTEGDFWHPLGALPADKTVTLPPRSVVTVAWGIP